MSWDNILKIVFGIIASVGGISGVIIAGIKFSSNIIAARLSKKYEMQLSKELEQYKTILDNKKYITKTKFDVEFKIYKEYTKAFSELVFAISQFVPGKYVNDDAFKAPTKDEFEAFINKINIMILNARNTLNSNIPFVEKDIYNTANVLLGLCENFFISYMYRCLGIEYDFSCAVPYMKKKTSDEYVVNDNYGFNQDDCNLVKKITDKLDVLNDKIRNYISELDIME